MVTKPAKFVLVLVGLTVASIALSRGFVVLSGMADHFMPHGQCVMWRKDLLSLFVVGNVLVALAYFAIPIYLGLMLRNDSEYLFSTKIMAGFAVFIFFCGMTHVFQVVTVWIPMYWSSTLMDLATGIVSLVVASQLRNFVTMLKRIAAIQREYEAIRGR